MGKQDNFKEEYRKFIFYYLLKIVGLETKSIQDICDSSNDLSESTSIFKYDNKNKILYFNSFTRSMFYYKTEYEIDEDDIALIRCILREFFYVCEYEESGKKNVDYNKSNEHKKINYEYAIQRGICQWITGVTISQKNNKSAPNKETYNDIEKIFRILDKWVIKTYEGKHVSYGLIYDRDNENDDNTIKSDDFIEFLKDEFSAVLTDSITSVFILNKKCNLISYETVFDKIDENGTVPGAKLINNLPLRFADLISKTVCGNRVGIFLLANGDLILCKRQAIRFAKREGKWLNFNIRSFKNALFDFMKENNISEKLIEEIYSSALDVSFSHSGGIIALDLDNSKIVDSFSETDKIINRCDYISDDTDEQITEYLLKKNSLLPKEAQIDEDTLNKDIKKKLLKRNIIKKLVDGKKFCCLNRKLRSELISLDGACIVDKEGNICSFGAIIQNDSGSSGGGRGAAAKKLSTNGFAIKISTDGYIELYCKQSKIFVIK